MTLNVSGIDKTEAWGTSATLPPGKHEVRITDAKEGKSSGGHDQLELEVEGVSGPYAGYNLRIWQVANENSWGMLKQLMIAADVYEEGKTTLDAAEFIGKRMAVLVEKKPSWKDPTKEYSEAVGYLRPSSTEGSNGGNGGGVPVESVPADDDIPF